MALPIFAPIFIYRSIAIYRWNMTYHDIQICEYVALIAMFPRVFCLAQFLLIIFYLQAGMVPACGNS